MTWKLMLVGLVLLGLLGLGWFKAGVLQLSRGEALRELSHRQSVRNKTQPSSRGNIYDRQGRLLAMSAPMWSVYAHPPQVTDVAQIATALAPILKQPPALVRSRLQSTRPFVWLAHMLGPGQAERIRDLSLAGVGLQQNTRRFYPNHTLLGQLLGSVSSDTGRGLSGVERAADALLRGTQQYGQMLVDALGRPLQPFAFFPKSSSLLSGDPFATPCHPPKCFESIGTAENKGAKPLRLTIDVDVQHTAEQALLDAVQKHKAKGAWAIVMDAQTGDLLSVAQAPLCNPNAPNPHDVACRNRAFFDAVEPGSVFKVVTLAAALQQGVVQPNERIFCGKKGYHVGGFVIRDVTKREWATAQEAFVRSINTGIIRIAQRMDKERFEQTIRRLGFGRRVDLGFAEEAPGGVPPARGWGKARFANITMGYGLTATSLQLVQAMATVANGGTPVKPRLWAAPPPLSATPSAHAKAAGSGLQKGVQNNTHNHGSIPLSAHNALASKNTKWPQQLTAMLKAVTASNGPGRKARIPGVHVAGKTGTAEKVDSQTGTYNKRRNRASFLGFAPADNPRIVAIVTVDEPMGKSAYGGDVAAPAWRRIVEAALARCAASHGK